MKNYYFYSKSDSKREPISYIKVDSKEEAIQFFSKLKNLTKERFLSIFKVSDNEKL